MANLFQAAKKDGPKKVAKEKLTITVNDPEFHTAVHDLVKTNEKMTDLKAEQQLLSGIVRERAIAELATNITSTKKFPGSFNIVGVGAKKLPEAKFLFIPTDKYITIDKERGEELTAEFGEEMVTETTTYTMDSALVEEYGEVISDMINKCKAIPDDAKARLINATVKYTVKKGTITEIPQRFPKRKVAEVIDWIKPVFMLKNVRIEAKKA